MAPRADDTAERTADGRTRNRTLDAFCAATPRFVHLLVIGGRGDGRLTRLVDGPVVALVAVAPHLFGRLAALPFDAQRAQIFRTERRRGNDERHAEGGEPAAI
jgi:hypothetical protein